METFTTDEMATIVGIKDALVRIAEAQERQADALETVAVALDGVTEQGRGNDTYTLRIASMISEIRSALNLMAR